jgi:phage terminase large subunit-like protein
VHCEPRIKVVPPGQVKDAGTPIAKIARMAGIELDEAQQMLAAATSGVGADDRWTAFEAVVFAPRQNLKTEFCLARILAGLFLFGDEYIVYSAHQVKTATKTFRRLRRAIDGSPELGGRIIRVSNRSGSETIELASGQVLECVARSTSSGRGFTGDTIVLDEAHELDADQLAAVLPMLSTRPNPQVLYALSLGNEQSTHLGVLRKRALSGDDPHVAWIEWSMAEGDRIDDREVWKRCNPAYPSRISMDYLEREWAALGGDPDVFARERLGKSSWPSDEAGMWEVVSEDVWAACYAPGALLDDPPVPAAAVTVPLVPVEQPWRGRIGVSDGIPVRYW